MHLWTRCCGEDLRFMKVVSTSPRKSMKWMFSSSFKWMRSLGYAWQVTMLSRAYSTSAREYTSYAYSTSTRGDTSHAYCTCGRGDTSHTYCTCAREMRYYKCNFGILQNKNPSTGRKKIRETWNHTKKIIFKRD